MSDQLDPTCANCGYESTQLNERDYCQTCSDAYDAGYNQATFELKESNE